MLNGGVCIGFVVEPLLKPELTALTIGMDVEYGHAGGGGHVSGGCAWDKDPPLYERARHHKIIIYAPISKLRGRNAPRRP